MKKILFVITKSNWGGAQRYVFDLATRLPKERFETAVALGGDQPDGKAGGLLAQKLHNANTTIYRSASLQRDISTVADVRSFFELYRLFKKVRPDVVHLNSSKAGGVGALAARLAGVPRIIFTAHGWPFWEPRNFIARALIWFASWATVLLAHKTIVISDYDKRVALRMPFATHKIVRVYNGIDLAIPFGGGEAVRRHFPPGAHITGTIGELNKNKNQVALIERARADKDMHVAIVGEGELRGFLQSKIDEYGLSERVKLLGFIPAPEALKGFDSFALPSLKEGLPYVLLEARAAGLPVDANPVGGIPEILNGKLEEFSLERMVSETAVLY